jgi:hypothetical protein
MRLLYMHVHTIKLKWSYLWPITYTLRPNIRWWTDINIHHLRCNYTCNSTANTGAPHGCLYTHTGTNGGIIQGKCARACCGYTLWLRAVVKRVHSNSGSSCSLLLIVVLFSTLQMKSIVFRTFHHFFGGVIYISTFWFLRDDEIGEEFWGGIGENCACK